MDLLQVLEQYWGYTSFRPLQYEAMQAILAQRDSLVVLPTGGGKSLCFQAPALVRDGLAVVISPLISLMKDQVDTLVANGVPAACYNSSLDADSRAAVSAGLREGRYRLLYVSPERVAGEGSEAFLAKLSTSNVRFIAVDEAHCISQWGHDFRPEYRQLARLRDAFGGISVHAYTATATARVRRDIIAELHLRDAAELVGSFDRPNLVYRVLPRANLKRQLVDVLDRHRGQAGIIYCTSRREVDALAQWLCGSGVRARPYHAGLSDDERSRNQDAFLEEDADVVVATVAFGMGIDRSDVRFVMHAGAPQSLEHYQQESGRAGRDGLEAECVLIYSAADFLKWRVMLERNGELTAARRTLLRDMERYAASVGCRHRHLVRYFGEPAPVPARAPRSALRDDSAEQFDARDITATPRNAKPYFRHASQAECGACDYCLGELEALSDPAVLARKVLSCVARVGQRFGTGHVTNVLRGSATEPVTARRHHELSTFGLLKDASVAEVRGYIEQLTGAGFLRAMGDEFPVLTLSETGVALLKDAAAAPDLALARQRQPVKNRIPRRSAVETESWQDVDRDLFERLRAVRLEIARTRGVPPYVIFHDTTLRDMARRKPTTLDAFRGVYGVGERKAQDLGEPFLRVIRDVQTPSVG